MNVAALYKISYGVYIVSSFMDGMLCGQIANTVFQLTSDPIQVAVCLNKQNTTHDAVEKSKVFAVSILSKKATLEFIGRFGFRSSKDFNKFEGIKYKLGKTKAPIVLENAVAYLEAEVKKVLDVGTHTLFVGEVVDADVIEDGEVMTYEYYHNVVKGKTPKTASVHIEG